jgi:hypothetical protein
LISFLCDRSYGIPNKQTPGSLDHRENFRTGPQQHRVPQLSPKWMEALMSEVYFVLKKVKL